ncbi:MAG: hypothetical protein IJ410_06195 [Oscillospiraceae bacterium]|nr:hypothetical protein [Oscillospiraceae bacterium]
MNQKEKYRFSQWDEESFVLPKEYILDKNSDLADALNVFYSAGGYEFFNVMEPEYYSGNWLNFIGNLYAEIDDGLYTLSNKEFTVPLTDEQKMELAERGVPQMFVTDIK